MTDPFELERFVHAQDPVLAQARQELRDGHKRSHWMWFIFPQLRGLGRSEMATRYGLGSLAEAEAYLDHPLLGPRLLDCTDLINTVQGRDVHQILGSPDDMKFQSCMTLFTHTKPGEAVFQYALQRYFNGAEDQRTLRLLAGDAVP
jgi:uncharacterized protein (DUF1810 family)